jgi:molybdenum transport protein
LGGIENLELTISKLKKVQKEKKIVAEAHTIEEAEILTRVGVHVIQVDKMPPKQFVDCVDSCKSINSEVIVIAAGGVNAGNAADYASAGADVLVTSWMYFAPPADIKAEILKI